MKGPLKKNDPKIGNWTLKWVQERVRGGHHQSLCKYLRFRTAKQKAEADAVGLTVEFILRTAFLVKNGHTAVPNAAITVYRFVKDVPASPVIAICRASVDRRLHMKNLAKLFSKMVPPGDMTQEMKDLVNEVAVRDVMET